MPLGFGIRASGMCVVQDNLCLCELRVNLIGVSDGISSKNPEPTTLANPVCAVRLNSEYPP